VHALGEAGVNVALGTDGAASNNDLDMLGEMRSAAYLAKGVARSASAVPAARALSMATLHGAKALGLHARTGSLARGKAADVVALDLSQIETTPVFDAIAQIVYACSRQQVSDVWVAGRQLLDRRRLVTLDEPSLAANADRWRERLTRPTARRA
jgi:5-methylthioadenosine/S-adenosylhomocysteine deaminase